MDLIKITSDYEKAKNVVKMTSLIEERMKLQNKTTMTALIIADYYEIIKELTTSILLIDGYKTLSHKDLVDYLKENYSEFDSNKISILNDLRILRNRISYEGFFVEPSFLNRNEHLFKEIILELKNLIKQKLK